MAKKNQGFIRDFNLIETINETQSLNNLGGAGIANDLRVLQNNLRNTSTLSFVTVVGAAISGGYFYFGPTSEFVYTDDDIVGIKSDITVGVGVTLYKNNTYYICNSNAENQFKLSTIPSTVGVNTINVSSLPPPTDIHYIVNNVIVGSGGTGYTTIPTVTISRPTTSWGIRATASAEIDNGSIVAIDIISPGRGYTTQPRITISRPDVGINTSTATLGITTNYYTNIDFVRKDSVSKENILNLISPNSESNEDIVSGRFTYLGRLSLNDTFEQVLSNNETSKFLTTKKYRSDQDTTSTNSINFEGSIKINDPQGFNVESIQLNDTKSPGVFIGDTRAFSSDNNPWTQVGTALSTLSSSVSIGELYFANNITITGISTESASSIDVLSYTHKLPVVINDETYYILLRT
jgi:hypothetical protein